MELDILLNSWMFFDFILWEMIRFLSFILICFSLPLLAKLSQELQPKITFQLVAPYFKYHSFCFEFVLMETFGD